jgi:hypothetical protein
LNVLKTIQNRVLVKCFPIEPAESPSRTQPLTCCLAAEGYDYSAAIHWKHLEAGLVVVLSKTYDWRLYQMIARLWRSWTSIENAKGQEEPALGAGSSWPLAD